MTRFEYDTEWDERDMPITSKISTFQTFEDARDILRSKVVASLRAGQFLGEKSFMFNTYRTSNILCVEDSFFAFLTKDDYKEVIMPIDEDRIIGVIDFVKQFRLFHEFEKGKLYDLNYYFRKV